MTGPMLLKAKGISRTSPGSDPPHTGRPPRACRPERSGKPCGHGALLIVLPYWDYISLLPYVAEAPGCLGRYLLFVIPAALLLILLNYEDPQGGISEAAAPDCLPLYAGGGVAGALLAGQPIHRRIIGAGMVLPGIAPGTVKIAAAGMPAIRKGGMFSPASAAFARLREAVWPARANRPVKALSLGSERVARAAPLTACSAPGHIGREVKLTAPFPCSRTGKPQCRPGP